MRVKWDECICKGLGGWEGQKACLCPPSASPLSHFSHVWLFVITGTVAHQAPLPMGFSRQECWGGLPCPPPGDLCNPEIKLTSLIFPASAGGFFTNSATYEAHPLSITTIVKFDKQTYWLLSGCRTDVYQHISGGRLKWWPCPIRPKYLSICLNIYCFK